MATVGELPSGSFRAQIRRKGLAAISRVFPTRLEAEAWAASREAELLSAQSQTVSKPNAGMTFAAAVERYLTGPKFADKAPGTQARERTCSVRLLQYFGNYALSVIDGAMVQEYIDMRCNERVKHKNGKKLDKKVSPDTVRLEKAFLSAVFKFSKRRNLIQANIMRDSFELPTCVPKEGRITLQQQVSAYNCAREMSVARNANPSLLPWVYFVFETGTRPGEAAKIELSWVDLEQRKISIPRVGQKKRNARVVLVGEELAEMLQECINRAEAAGSKFLFFSRGNAPLERDAKGRPIRRRRDEAEMAARPCKSFSYYNAWRTLTKAAGIPKNIHPHLIRHEFISRLFEETDLNDSQIASLVGDVNVLSLEPYKHLRVEQLRNRQDAHLDGTRAALKALEELRASRLEAHLRSVRQRAQAVREAAGDSTSPMDRLYAARLAEGLIQKAASTEGS